MHIVIVGVGGVGGYFGGKIAASGQRVTMLCRGEHLQKIKRNGLQVNSINGDFITHPYAVTDTISEIEKADLILICTKSWQVADAAASIIPLLKPETLVIPLQNGADNAEKVSSNIPKQHVLGGLCKLYSKIEAPGIITHFGHDPELIFGTLNNQTGNLDAIKAVFDKADFRNRISKDIQLDIWSKFMFIATVSGLGALTRVSIGRMHAQETLRTMMKNSAQEIYEIATARSVKLPADLVTTIMQFISTQPYDSTASTQRDIMEGRPSELENFNGFITSEGKRLGIPTPTHDVIYNCLLPMEKIARS